MSNRLFAIGKEGLLDDAISLSVATIKCVLLRGYVYNAAHDMVSDITGAGGVLVGTPQALTSKTFTNGVSDAADVTFTAVAAGAACDMILIYQSSAVGGGADVAASAQRVIALIDTATNLPVTPNGTDIAITWDSGANKIFAL